MSAQNRFKTDPYRGVSLILLTILVSPVAIYCAARFVLHDFSIYWYATARWLAGSNPYELPDLVAQVTGELGGKVSKVENLKVWAPPYFVLMMSPFAALSIDVAKMLYLTVSFGSLAGWISLTYQELTSGVVSRRVWDSFKHLAFAVMVLPWCVTKSAIIWGGMSVLASTAFLLLATTRNCPTVSRWFLFWLLVSIKPHAVFGAAVAFMILLPSRERWRSLVALAAAGVLFGFVLLTYSPQVFDQFLALDSSVVREYQVATQTFVGGLLKLGMSVETSYLVSGSLWLLLLLPVLKMRRASMGFREIVAVALIFNTLSIYLSPYAWMHDYQSALGLMWALWVVGGRSGRLAVCNIALILAINLAQIIWGIYFVGPQAIIVVDENSFWSGCAALYAMLSCINILWVSKNARHPQVA